MIGLKEPDADARKAGSGLLIVWRRSVYEPRAERRFVLSQQSIGGTMRWKRLLQ